MAGAKGAGARGGKGNGKKRARAAAAADAPGAEEEHARAARRAKVRGTDPIPHTPTRLRVVKAPTGRSACAQNTPLHLIYTRGGCWCAVRMQVRVLPP